MKRQPRAVIWALGVLVALAVVTLAAPATAAETTRAEYVAGVEPICKANAEANEMIFAPVRAEVKAGKLMLAGARFARAAKTLKRTLAELKAVPRPASDQATLAKWLGYVSAEAGFFETAARKLKEGNKAGAQAAVVRLTEKQVDSEIWNEDARAEVEVIQADTKTTRDERYFFMGLTAVGVLMTTIGPIVAGLTGQPLFFGGSGVGLVAAGSGLRRLSVLTSPKKRKGCLLAHKPEDTSREEDGGDKNAE